MPTLRELKGAPLSVIVCLFSNQRPMREQELIDQTGYTKTSVGTALRYLSGPSIKIVLAIPNGRHPVWKLNDNEGQQILKAKFLPSGGGSGININSSIDNELTTTTTVKAKISPSPEVELLVRVLLSEGCPEDKAIESVTSALNRGETSPEIAQRITDARSYCRSPSGKGLFAKGHWIAACIQDGRAIPQAPRVDADLSRYDGYIQEQA